MRLGTAAASMVGVVIAITTVILISVTSEYGLKDLIAMALALATFVGIGLLHVRTADMVKELLEVVARLRTKMTSSTIL